MDSNPSFDVNQSLLLQKYPSIQGFFRLSCKTGKGLAQFKEALLAQLVKVEMVETLWPGSWFTVKSKLEQMDDPYISVEEFKECCAEAGITDTRNRKMLANSLHDLGVIVHFKDMSLDAMYILNSVWVTRAIYKIITTEKIAKSNGYLKRTDVTKILKGLPIPLTERLQAWIGLTYKKWYFYPAELHPYIIDLMEKLELCYRIDKGAMIIPQLRPIREPKLDFKQDGSLGFVLHYHDVLPPLVFPRFIVKVHKNIKAATFWRTGVLLEDKQSGAQALVKADAEARRINLWVQGERRRDYLHYLRSLLADINNSFEKLAVSESDPC
jgi:hypothetical protein